MNNNREIGIDWTFEIRTARNETWRFSQIVVKFTTIFALLTSRKSAITVNSFDRVMHGFRRKIAIRFVPTDLSNYFCQFLKVNIIAA